MNSPFLLKMIEICQTPQTIYVVLELCTEGDFFTVLQQKGLTDQQKKFYIKQLLAGDVNMHEDRGVTIFKNISLFDIGVSHLHFNGFAHRDLSLENLLLSGDYKLKICDFGMILSHYVCVGWMLTVANDPARWFRCCDRVQRKPSD